jgi:hypothetical protein
MQTCGSTEQVASALLSHRAGLIAVDGFQGSGKSTLAKTLGHALGLKVIHADDYLIRNRGAFFKYLVTDRIATDVAATGPCIIEGLCCLKILQAIGQDANCLVYVKRMAIWGWADEDELESYATKGLKVLHGQVDPLAQSLHDLWDEVAGYHMQFQPHIATNIIYERGEA